MVFTDTFTAHERILWPFAIPHLDPKLTVVLGATDNMLEPRTTTQGLYKRLLLHRDLPQQHLCRIGH